MFCHVLKQRKKSKLYHQTENKFPSNISKHYHTSNINFRISEKNLFGETIFQYFLKLISNLFQILQRQY